MYQKKEQEIMQNWKGDGNKPVVSICSTAYNHENYIGETLDGFLMQETDFPFEILIHDDCSTDKTADIIRLYEKKYPNIIKPIYQTENQYSKGIKPDPTFNFPRAKGKYIARCEGDDYWIDKDKLQFQIERMKENASCQISFHSAYIQQDLSLSNLVMCEHSKHENIFTIGDVILGDGNFMPTPSIIFKKEAITPLPDFLKSAPVVDYFIQILASQKGGALYLNKPMSVYRQHTSGSWSSLQNNFFTVSQHAKEMVRTLRKVDHYYKYRYHDQIMVIVSNYIYRVLINKNFDIINRKDFYKEMKDFISSKHKYTWMFQYQYPILWFIYRLGKKPLKLS